MSLAWLRCVSRRLLHVAFVPGALSLSLLLLVQGTVGVVMSSLLNLLVAVESYVASPAYIGRFGHFTAPRRYEPVDVANCAFSCAVVAVVQRSVLLMLSVFLAVPISRRREAGDHGHRGLAWRVHRNVRIAAPTSGAV